MITSKAMLVIDKECVGEEKKDDWNLTGKVHMKVPQNDKKKTAIFSTHHT